MTESSWIPKDTEVYYTVEVSDDEQLWIARSYIADAPVIVYGRASLGLVFKTWSKAQDRADEINAWIRGRRKAERQYEEFSLLTEGGS